MAEVQTTRMSSTGQVVIPGAIRTKLGLEPGVQFVVVGDGDTIVLKLIVPPSMRDFDRIMKRARQEARRAGMSESDVASAIAAVRAR